MTTAELTVIHNKEQSRFEVHIDDLLAELDYTVSGNVITFTHTGVPAELEGHGIGSKLARAGLDYARQNKLRAVSLCWFVNNYVERNFEYQELFK